MQDRNLRYSVIPYSKTPDWMVTVHDLSIQFAYYRLYYSRTNCGCYQFIISLVRYWGYIILLLQLCSFCGWVFARALLIDSYCINKYFSMFLFWSLVLGLAAYVTIVRDTIEKNSGSSDGIVNFKIYWPLSMLWLIKTTLLWAHIRITLHRLQLYGVMLWKNCMLLAKLKLASCIKYFARFRRSVCSKCASNSGANVDHLILLTAWYWMSRLAPHGHHLRGS
jgi:hypothetical protein